MSWHPRRRKHGDTEILIACIIVGVFLLVCVCSAGLGLI